MRAGRDDDSCRDRAAKRCPIRRARRSRSRRARRSTAPRSPTCRRRWPTNCGSIRRPRASSSPTSPTARRRNRSASRRATSSSRSTTRRSPRPAISERPSARAGSRLWRITIDARRPADLRHVRRMSRAAAPTARDAASEARQSCSPRGAASSAMRRVRLPTSCGRDALAEVVGQDHLLGPDGALTRMLETRSLGSLIFWGPPGTGKTTVARLLARRHRAAFRADLGDVFRRRRSEEGVRRGARCAARPGRARCCSSTRSTASTARSRIRFCR